MAIARIEADIFCTGNITGRTLTIPDSTILDAAVSASASIQATKLQHQHRVGYSQPNTTATTETRVLYRCYGATASIIEFCAGSQAIAVGSATVTFDLQKSTAGGAFATVLSSVITLNSSSVARVAQVATLASASLVAGDLLEVIVTATAAGGTVPTGIFAALTVNEKPA